MMMGDAERWCPRRDHSVDESDIRTGRGPYGGPVRWSSLFADLESQLQAAEDQERLAAVPEVTRAERAAVALADRLRGHAGGLRLALRDGSVVAGEVVDMGPSWVLLADGPREHLVPTAGLSWVVGLGEAAAPDAGPVMSRLTLGHALRAVARDRAVVRVRTDGGDVVGRVDGVGRDHVDVTRVHPDSLRPTGERCAVPWSALLLLSRL